MSELTPKQKMIILAQSMATSMNEKFRTLKDPKQSTPAMFLPMTQTFVEEAAALGRQQAKSPAKG